MEIWGGYGGGRVEIWGGYGGGMVEMYLRGHGAEVAEGEAEGARLAERHQPVVEPTRLVRGTGGS